MTKYPDIKDGTNVFKFDNFSPEIYLDRQMYFMDLVKPANLTYLMNS
jgi:hypothetical protein